MNIFVAKMSSSTTQEDLMNLFGEHGTVSSAKIITDRETGNSKCYGFIEMENDAEGQSAIDTLNDTMFQGRKIVVKKARSKEEMANDRGGDRGGWQSRPRREFGNNNRGGGSRYRDSQGQGRDRGGDYQDRGERRYSRQSRGEYQGRGYRDDDGYQESGYQDNY